MKQLHFKIERERERKSEKWCCNNWELGSGTLMMDCKNYVNLMFQYSSEMIPAQISNPFKPKRRVLMSCLYLHVIIQTVQSVLCNLC